MPEDSRIHLLCFNGFLIFDSVSVASSARFSLFYFPKHRRFEKTMAKADKGAMLDNGGATCLQQELLDRMQYEPDLFDCFEKAAVDGIW